MAVAGVAVARHCDDDVLAATTATVAVQVATMMTDQDGHLEKVTVKTAILN